MHGLTRNSRDFDELAADLADRGCRVVCMDVVGRGDSDWLEHKDDYGFDLYLSDAASLLARLTAGAGRHPLLRWMQGEGAELTIDWVGTSMGGLLGHDARGQGAFADPPTGAERRRAAGPVARADAAEILLAGRRHALL